MRKKKKEEEEEILMVPFATWRRVWPPESPLEEIDLLSDQGEGMETIFHSIDSLCAQIVVDKMVRSLSEREQKILRYRFFGEEKMTFKEIGMRLGISTAWTRDLYQRTFKKLRETQHAQSLHPLL